MRAALMALGLTKQQAANRRKFLVVKSEGVDVEDQQTNDAPPVLASTVKESILRVLTDALERLVAAVELVKTAEETAAEGAEILPESISRAVDEVAALLSGATARYAAPMDKDENDTSKALRAIADSAGELAEAAKGDGGLDDESIQALLQLLAAISTPPSAAQDADGQTVETDKGDAELAAALSQISEAASALSDAAKTQDSLTTETVVSLRQLATMLNDRVRILASQPAKATRRSQTRSTPC